MSQPDILLLHRKEPYPPSSGVDNRVWKTAERLNDVGNVVIAAPWQRTSAVPSVDTIDISMPWLDWKVTRIYAWNGFFLLGSEPERNPVARLITNEVLSRIIESQFEPDLVISECLQLGEAAHKLAQRYDVALLVDQHNSEFEILEQYLTDREIPTIVRDRLVGNLRDYEQQMIDRANVVVFQSSEDVDDFDTSESSNYRVIPNGSEVAKIRTSDKSTVPVEELDIDPEKPTCIYVGAFDYEPNRKAAAAIAETIAPECPNVNFLIVGRNPPEYHRHNVITPGFVEDLGAYLQYADVALCPLTMGSGTKLKMLDYLAAGLPIVTTQLGLQGLDLNDGEHVVQVDRIEEFPEAIRGVLDSPERRAQLEQNSYNAADKYAWDSLLCEYDDIIEELIT